MPSTDLPPIRQLHSVVVSLDNPLPTLQISNLDIQGMQYYRRRAVKLPESIANRRQRDTKPQNSVSLVPDPFYG